MLIKPGGTEMRVGPDTCPVPGCSADLMPVIEADYERVEAAVADARDVA